ncbi:hypothetical protein R3P38DRAFT_3181414 [Favolaschia claudopus]|uniref:Uncharacterized protein n=1 Tax=Favolaschia claudopus TaxID=2862362 RepID=A0AAW0CKH5_9AGAR
MSTPSKTAADYDHPGPLDPGVPARNRLSFCKLCLYATLAIFSLALATFLYGAGKGVLELTRISHSKLYQNQTLQELGTSLSGVVRPLIDANQSFDIAVSIWVVHRSEGEGNESAEEWEETPVYSDIAFRGVHLRDKHKNADINYSLPVSIFDRLTIKETDLRASFVFIPTSPSPADHIYNFSSWRPPNMIVPPVRAYPFPLGTADKGQPDVADRALDSFAISIPLLEFYEYGSRCAKSGSDVDEEPFSEGNKTVDLDSEAKKLDSDETEKSKDKDDDADDEEEERDQVKEKEDTLGPADISDIAKYPEHALKRHPFIVTRTHIRAVDETHLFNRKLYNKEHNKLRASSCGQASSPDKSVTPELKLCKRQYQYNGHWETRFELRVPVSSEGSENTVMGNGKTRTEWAYAPYLSHTPTSAGAKDLVAVPVSRENCTFFADTPSLPVSESIDIHWRLSYTGRSPLKLVFGDALKKTTRVHYNASDFKKATAHASAEMMNSIAGHQFYENSHPRRRFVIGLLRECLSPAVDLLSTGYWYTRTTTVSLSISGTSFHIVNKLLFTLLSKQIEQKKELAESSKTKLDSDLHWVLDWVWDVVGMMMSLAVPFFMLKTIARLAFSFGFEKSNFPLKWLPFSVRRLNATHMERADNRLDLRTSWRVKIGFCTTLIAFNYISIHYYHTAPFEYLLLSPTHPPPAEGDTTHVTLNTIFAQFYAYINMPLWITANLLQFILNYRSKIFGGSYKLFPLLRCVDSVLQASLFVPWIVGRYEMRPGLKLYEVVDWAFVAGRSYQAIVYPRWTEEMEERDKGSE